MNEERYNTLKRNVSMLGQILGKTINEGAGSEFLDKVEEIRLLSKSARLGNIEDKQRLKQVLRNLTPEELLPVSRAFSQFLNLANIADQHNTISRDMDDIFSATETLSDVFDLLQRKDCSPEVFSDAIKALRIELVLTAHPTEITRRTLIHKHGEIDSCLSRLEFEGVTQREKESIYDRLSEVIAQIWHTYDFRRARPTPVEEAKWGFAVIENSLWDAVPDFLRLLDKTLSESTGIPLPIDIAPIKFVSWMGGDRDGNPNVTAVVTDEVLLLSRWQAVNLYLQNIEELIEELSMTACSEVLAEVCPNAQEPYRMILRNLRERLRNTLTYLEQRLANETVTPAGIIVEEHELWDPLYICYQSLIESGMAIIANGKLLDLLRRVKCFGIHLVQLDIRQNSDRHAEVFSELTQYLEIGDYAQWDEAEKCRFLLDELENKRPLIPEQWQPSPDVNEVLDTCKVIAAHSSETFGCYIISMARQPSDVLAAELLLKACGVSKPPPVAPLFETLDDLNRARDVIDKLINIPSYFSHLNRKLTVMIGYSDSAKDAGMLAASWAQYCAQEALVESCQQSGIKLTLFHGRGGTIGRGGAPAHAALLSQPPGSLVNGLRVTEQGEMIRTKLGLKGLAIKTFALYTSAILQANLIGPPKPSADWRKIMDQLSSLSCDNYRGYVLDNEGFVSYFREATPEQELAKLPLGSRPARRKPGGGIASLRAIPWIFAWSQNRLMLPAWLGAGKAIEELVRAGKLPALKEMSEKWPFFATRLSMLEMVFAKTDSGLSEYYDLKLVSEEYSEIGKQLRQQLAADTKTILQLLGKASLLENESWSAQSILLRNIYTDPLNYLQAELLERNRKQEDSNTEQAIMVTIAGIAAGMRNTG